MRANVVKILKIKANKLKNELVALYYAYKDPQTRLLPRILIISTLGYALSPIDLIPDFIPILGYLDDLIIIPVLITISIKLIPEAVMKRAKERAIAEPVLLKKNYIVATLIIGVWVLLISLIIVKIL